MSPAKNSIQQFLNHLSNVNGPQLLPAAFEDPNERLRVILETSAYMAQLIEHHRLFNETAGASSDRIFAQVQFAKITECAC